MKVLIVSSYLPYPLHSGGSIRLYNLIKNLQKDHEITLVCEKRNYQTQRDTDEVSKICHKVVVFNRPKTWSLRNILLTIFSMNPMLITAHTHKRFSEIIKKELSRNSFDLIHVETFYVMQNLPKTNIPIILVEHNVEYMVYKRYARNAPFMLRPILYFDAVKLARVERNSWKKATKNITVSLDEKQYIGEDTEIIPNGVDIYKFRMKKIVKDKKDPSAASSKGGQAGQEKRVLFIGNFKLPESIKNLRAESVIFDENAPDETELIFQKADLLLAPIRVGGGTKFKILESMASGTPVITTPLGNEGINARDGSEILIAEKPAELARKTVSLLGDDYLYEKISRNGRKFIEENYDWKKISERLDAVYRNLVQEL
ncbi:MAG: glycosyltransferase PslH [Microgenomates group bacterium GW2011_GWA2_37_6]|nr:MAG: glycosyltransferase PslH [Microgenomates group bacterium GW2011_GWA2_37_6]